MRRPLAALVLLCLLSCDDGGGQAASPLMEFEASDSATASPRFKGDRLFDRHVHGQHVLTRSILRIVVTVTGAAVHGDASGTLLALLPAGAAALDDADEQEEQDNEAHHTRNDVDHRQCSLQLTIRCKA